jgi:hypothetical protein
MDIKNLQGLMEAYQQVNAPQEEVEEILEAEGSYGQTPKARSAMGKLAVSRMRKPASEYSQRGEKTKKVKAAEKHASRQNRLASGNNRHGSRGPMDQARRNWSRGADEYGHTGYDGEGHGGSVTKNPKKLRKQKAMGEFSKEDYEIFDTVLEFLCVEGYVETLEEAEWLMANELDVEDIEAILEAEGSYGKTPKASAAYSALVRKRTNKPASEYSKKGEKTKKVKSAEKHMWRSLRDGPHHGRGKMTADDRTERRSERAFDLETSYGSGSVTKNPKKLRKQKAMGEIGESYDAYNVVLSYLLDEGFASTEYSADKIILNMSEAWFEDIMELNRYEKETGKDSRTGKPTSSGGKYGGSDTQSKVMRSVMKSMGSGRMGVQPRGQKKEPGKKPPKAGEYGGPASPEQKVAKRRADKKRGEEMMHSARD